MFGYFTFGQPTFADRPGEAPVEATIWGWASVETRSTIALSSVSRLMPPVPRFVEVFRPRGWMPAVSTAVELRSRSDFSPALVPQRIETFYPRGWLPAARTEIEPRSSSRETRLDQFIETFYPRAWSAAAKTAVEPRSSGGIAPPTPQFIETFLPQAWRSAAATAIAPETRAGLAIHRLFVVPPDILRQAWGSSVKTELKMSSSVFVMPRADQGAPPPSPPLGTTRRPLFRMGGGNVSSTGFYWPGRGR